MSIRITAFLTAVLMLLSAGACLAEGEKTYLTVYEGPKTMESSKTASVRVNGYDGKTTDHDGYDRQKSYDLFHTCYLLILYHYIT